MLQAGSATVDITPNKELELAGWAFGKSKGVLDPLYATCLILKVSEKQPIVIISTDLIGIERKYIVEIRNKINIKYSIPPKNIMISATHTHSGPSAVDLKDWGRIDDDYISRLISEIVECTGKAIDNKQKATIGYGKGLSSDKFIVNREKDQEIIDNQIGVLSVKDKNGGLIALVANYTCHPVGLHSVNNNLYSADYPGYIRKKLIQEIGKEVNFLFLNGASGNINPEFVEPGGPVSKQEKTKEMGFELGEKILEINAEINTEELKILAVKSEKFSLELQELPSLPELKKEKNKWQQKLKNLSVCTDQEEKSRILLELEYLEKAINVRKKGQMIGEWEIEIQAIRINNFVLLGLPLEPYVQPGLKIKEKSPFKYTFIVGLANGAYSYLPVKSSFANKSYTAGGLAHKVYGIYLIKPDSAEKVVESAFQVLQKLT
ncbi:MAG: neutral/alkaline non-lysosomal ceramidase N-terminal domain-containing protein [Bacillota bacterium]